MSWIGQSLAVHSIAIAATKHHDVAAGDRLLACPHGRRPDHPDEVRVGADQERDERPDLRV